MTRSLFAYGRLGIFQPRTLSILIAALGFVAIVLVPTLKYPANPPSVGNPKSIGIRTSAFFLMIGCSVAAMVLALQVGRRVVRRLRVWNGWLLATALFLLITSIVAAALPVVDEVPAGFPVTLMWKFRVASLGMQTVIWATLGVFLGWLTERDGKWQHR